MRDCQLAARVNRWLALLLMSGLLCACTGVALNPTAPAAAEASLLMAVRFANAYRSTYQPTLLILTLEDEARSVRGQFPFSASRTMPGQFAEFPVRLDLPPGRYVITRISGAAGRGTVAPQFDFPVRIHIETRAGQADYAGRLEVVLNAAADAMAPRASASFDRASMGEAGFGDSTPKLRMVSDFEEDSVSLRVAYPGLKGRELVAAAPARIEGTDPPVTAQLPAPVVAADTVAPGPLSPRQASTLPAALRQPFTDFLRRPLPRALAAGSPGGAASTGTGWLTTVAVGGTDAVARALADCKRRAGGAAAKCRLVAVDQTLLWTDDAARPATALSAAVP